ncbi:tRNA pseudouridine(65) synthase TruC [Parashewanella spongiae]|uniref:tRNA pseudouridine synthase C n=1 Tax=Parashewanella spongiae TaxID=342950 RepID=A0A3A6TZD6_9GAMM|nr:tRNA pseudouridine(65) synthase TruC [Parashewanella spongiae]MCL1079847.1 tRNA pseudouridine(65) synthase TruC [Parashewanella spongiae]RJY06845.1 tRNA pseudouridine(65) synthase TruC [Parashewanella spongiae]
MTPESFDHLDTQEAALPQDEGNRDEISPELHILYEDEFIVAIHKPAGLLVHRSYLARRERFFAMQLTRDLVGCHVFPVHRLDRPTSGVLLFAKNSEVANNLCKQFEEHSIEKQYLALVRGHVTEGGKLDYALREELDDVADKFSKKDKDAQAAITLYQPLLNTEVPYQSGRYPTSRFALVQMQPLSGRKHQLRRHMAHLRHPIIGDTTHGDGKQNRFFRDFQGLNRLWLIAKKLVITHPISGERISIETELEDHWLNMFEMLGWDESALSTGDTQKSLLANRVE